MRDRKSVCVRDTERVSKGAEQVTNDASLSVHQVKHMLKENSSWRGGMCIFLLVITLVTGSDAFKCLSVQASVSDLTTTFFGFFQSGAPSLLI